MTRSVLFVCNMNSIRSPMAAAILARLAGDRLGVDSAGVWEGALDPFVPGVLSEIDVSLGDYRPKSLADVSLADFDLVIALTPEAVGEVRRAAPTKRIEFWPIDNPTDVRGGRDELMDAYRGVRDALKSRIQMRFPGVCETS